MTIGRPILTNDSVVNVGAPSPARLARRYPIIELLRNNCVICEILWTRITRMNTDNFKKNPCVSVFIRVQQIWLRQKAALWYNFTRGRYAKTGALPATVHTRKVSMSVQPVVQSPETILQRLDAILRELQDLREMVAHAPVNATAGNLAQQLYGVLGRGTWDEYDPALDWQRFNARVSLCPSSPAPRYTWTP